MNSENTAPLPDAFGRYIVDGILGKGSMGTVYRGRDPELDRGVAIKVLAPEGAAEKVNRADLLERFKREASAYDALTHENIVALYDVGVTDDNRPYLVMELINGSSLDGRIRERGPLEPVQVAHIGEQIARALQHAHDAGLVHRDVKPANIIVTASGLAKLMDFGIARTSLSNLTADGTFVGSLLFASPEQVSARQIDGRSDLFSLGVTLYLLVTGRHPFSRKSLRESISAIETLEPPKASWLRTVLAPAWDDLLNTALAKTAELRYQSGDLMAAALAELKDPRKSFVQRELEFDIVFVAGPEMGTRAPLGRSTILGRAGGPAALQIGDERVSSRHCSIEVESNRVILKDLGSLNGTYVDGTKIEQVEVNPLSKILLGPQTEIRIIPRDAPDALAESMPEGDGGGVGASTRVMPGAIDYVLVVERGPLKGSRLVLGGSLMLSRSDGKGRLDDPAVSRQHAVVEVHDDGRVIARDVGSKNGTFVDNERIEEVQLLPGQKLRVGSTVLILRRAEGV